MLKELSIFVNYKVFSLEYESHGLIINLALMSPCQLSTEMSLHAYLEKHVLILTKHTLD